jgi:putative transposase
MHAVELVALGVYRLKPVTGADDLAVMRRIDEPHLEPPFHGSRRMMFELNKEGRGINRKRVRRLMRVMGIEALVPRPGTSKAAPGHKICPYLPRGLTITGPNPIWAAGITGITGIPMARGFLYLVAIVDWTSRAVLAWRLSNTMDTRFFNGVSCRQKTIGRFPSAVEYTCYRFSAPGGAALRVGFLDHALPP